MPDHLAPAAAAPNIPVRAFLNLLIPHPDDWDAPDVYKKAAQPYINSDPWYLLLPWPVEAIPGDGDRVYPGYGLLDSYMVRAGSRLYARIRAGVIVDIELVTLMNGVETKWFLDGKNFTVRNLLDAAEWGWMIDINTSITEMLERAGLPATLEALIAAESPDPEEPS